MYILIYIDISVYLLIKKNVRLTSLRDSLQTPSPGRAESCCAACRGTWRCSDASPATSKALFGFFILIFLWKKNEKKA